MILAVYGKGGMGHEIYELAHRINIAKDCYAEIIFVDDNADCDIDAGTGARVVTFEAAIAAYAPTELFFAIGVGEPTVRHTLYVKIKEAGYSVATLVHPNVTIPASSCVEGAIIFDSVYVSYNTTIKENTIILPLVRLGHDCVYGYSCLIASGVNFGGNISVGDRVFVGMTAAVKEGTSIGDDSIIGIGSIVLHDVPESVVAIGTPARIVRNNTSHRIFG